MDLVLGRGAWQRDRGAFPPWRQQNCLLEESKTDPKGYNILSRPPLIAHTTVGAGPISGVFKNPGVFAGSLFVVSGGTLYKDGVSQGAIDGSDLVSWAAGQDELVLTRGATAYSYKSTGLAAIAFPDGANVRAVNYMARRFFFVRVNSGRFYWSELDDGRTIDGLSYATAESEQDELFDIKRKGDLFWMLGANTGEAWVLTGDPDLPLSRVTQMILGRGVLSTRCAEEIEGTVYFVSRDGMVCMIDQAAIRISDSALEEKIRQASVVTTFWFQYEGKPLLCIRVSISGGTSSTYVLDLALKNQPSIFKTNGRSLWAARCATMSIAEPYFGDDTNNTVWKFDESSTTDSGESTFERIFSAGAPGDGIPIHNVVVNGNSGAAAFGTPAMEMRFSRDAGRTFSAWKSTGWGLSGEYRRFARFGSCGYFREPGFLSEYRVTACIPLRVASVRANVSVAGRGTV